VTSYRVTLRFRAGGPAATGDWTEETTARKTWRDWVDLYGSSETVVVRLTEQTDAGEDVLMLWEHGRLVEQPA
jgi:hypothetical protein